MDISLAYTVITGVFVAGAAWGGTAAALNGTKRRVQEVHERFTNHEKETTDRLARIETKLDMLTKD